MNVNAARRGEVSFLFFRGWVGDFFLMMGEDFFFFFVKGGFTHRIGREGRGKER